MAVVPTYTLAKRRTFSNIPVNDVRDDKIKEEQLQQERLKTQILRNTIPKKKTPFSNLVKPLPWRELIG